MALYNFEIGTEFTGTGTASTSAASKTVSGMGTSFDTEFASGYLVTVAGETRVVDTITSATTMTVTENFTTGSGGAVAYTGVNLINVESLATPLAAPRSTPPDFSQAIELASGGVRGAGWNVVTWSWAIMSQAQYDQLRTFCTDGNKSADVYIRTRKDDMASYAYYSAVLVWPSQPARDSQRVLGMVATFRNLSEISVS